MRMHPIKIKRPEFGIFSRLYWDLIEDEEKFHGVCRTNIEQFYRLSQLVAEEMRKHNTAMGERTPEERLAIFLGMCYKNQ